MNIKPLPNPNMLTSKTGTLSTGGLLQHNSTQVTLHNLISVLGEPNVTDDPSRVTASWQVTIDDEPCACWDWKGSFRSGRVSTWGSHSKWHELATKHGFNYVSI